MYFVCFYTEFSMISGKCVFSGYIVYIIIVFCGQSCLICSFVVLNILIVLSVFMVYIVLRLWYSVVVCSSVRGR